MTKLLSKYLKEIEELRHDYTKAKKRGAKFPQTQDALQKQAINFYREYGYQQINHSLRNLPVPPADDNEMNAEEAITILDKMLEEAPKRRNTIKVYRGERDGDRTKKLYSMNEGESFIDTGFMSVSLSASYAFYAFSSNSAFPGLSMIILPNTVKAAYISDPSEHKETEMLIARNTTYTLSGKKIIPNTQRNHRHKTIPLMIWVAS